MEEFFNFATGSLFHHVFSCIHLDRLLWNSHSEKSKNFVLRQWRTRKYCFLLSQQHRKSFSFYINQQKSLIYIIRCDILIVYFVSTRK